MRITLEGLQPPCRVLPLNIASGDQFKPEFLAITPNHSIPAIVDPDGVGNKPLTLFESDAILIYLVEKAGRLMPLNPAPHLMCLQWLMFQMDGVGPMFGQYHHLAADAPANLPYAIQQRSKAVAPSGSGSVCT